MHETLTPSRKLPSPHQYWAHSTCSTQALYEAFHSAPQRLQRPPTIQKPKAQIHEPEIVTAIETDIVMGYSMSQAITSDSHGSCHLTHPDEDTSQLVPIMAHPPDNTSDLTFEDFLEKIFLFSNPKTNVLEDPLVLTAKHIKLDFKQVETIPVCMDILFRHLVACQARWMKTSSSVREERWMSDKTIYFNADILPGPGYRNDSPTIDADLFIQTCFHNFIEKCQGNYAFSLGWKVDCRALSGYTQKDINDMKHIIHRYQLLEKTQGVVLAVNARILRKNCKPLESILHESSNIQLLVWTGTGEPPISSFLYNHLCRYFRSRKLDNQVGFDCKIESRWIKGILLDVTVALVGIIWSAKRIFERRFKPPCSAFDVRRSKKIT